MAPYLDSVRSFADVPVTDAGVDTVTFLEAAKGLVGLFDILGSTAFAAVKADLNGNITKLETRYNAHKEKGTTIELLIKDEQATEKKKTTTEGLVWLLRGLSFTAQGLSKAQGDKDKEIAAAFTESYEGTLKKFHNFVVKGVFAVAMKACPYRKDFYEKLRNDPAGGEPATQEKLDEKLDAWLAALIAIVTRLETFLETNKFDKSF
ncbi:glycolipid transfer protein domain-containing protein [Flagelloscypha sp. PMI_526]|nr:glycolipid transfer protein domain-containing protein [Flagelloscypha sp. PMI_526]